MSEIKITDRETAIRHIEGLFPPDSDNLENAKTGQILLRQAKQQAQGWKSEPTEVLIRLAELCIQREIEDEAKREALYNRTTHCTRKFQRVVEFRRAVR